MVVHVDVETNGFSRSDSSLLSVYAEKECGEKYERFYFPVEEYNKKAIAVNGLDEDEVEKRRGDATYPAHFKDDHADLDEFLSGCTKFVAFNVSFDFKWMPQDYQDSSPKLYCTMKNCKDMVGALNVKGHKKNPNLKEAAEYFHIKVASEELHDAAYDTQISKGIYEHLQG